MVDGSLSNYITTILQSQLACLQSGRGSYIEFGGSPISVILSRFYPYNFSDCGCPILTLWFFNPGILKISTGFLTCSIELTGTCPQAKSCKRYKLIYSFFQISALLQFLPTFTYSTITLGNCICVCVCTCDNYQIVRTESGNIKNLIGQNRNEIYFKDYVSQLR